MIDIDLLADRCLAGTVRFVSVRAGAEIYRLVPEGLLTSTQVEHLAASLRTLPAEREGIIGQYQWRHHLHWPR